jgi:type IV pilus biogenesis protein CpaD/CtpE
MRSFWWFSVGWSAALILVIGCASKPKSEVPAVPAQEAKKGHWVTLPPPTGSLLPQRVWVEDDGTVSQPRQNVRHGSAATVDAMQRQSVGGVPGGGQ